MPVSPQDVLAQAVELERRDAAAARELDRLHMLGERVSELRRRAAEVRSALERMPLAVEELGSRLAEAKVEASRARSALEAAEVRLAELEGARRRRADDVERARSEVGTARDALVDATREIGRLEARDAALHAEATVLADESEALVQAARAAASALREVPRVASGAGDDPGGALEEWAGQARSALFVARGLLEQERERIVQEANALGSAVLGEPLGASSVALVRRRLEERL